MDEISKLLWKEQKEKELQRAYKFCVEVLKSPLTIEEFEKVWYNEKEDKKGKKYLANMCMSVFQTRKANAGNSFENYLERLFQTNNLEFLKQKHVDSEGEIYLKKPKKGVHKLDFIIPFKNNKNTNSSIIVSAKTKFRERWRQDLDLKDKCIKLIYLTKENPSLTLIEQITGYGTIIVYPDALTQENVWSFDDFILRMKHFQKFGSYNLT